MPGPVGTRASTTASSQLRPLLPPDGVPRGGVDRSALILPKIHPLPILQRHTPALLPVNAPYWPASNFAPADTVVGCRPVRLFDTGGYRLAS
jgi:hypothetical protein